MSYGKDIYREYDGDEIFISGMVSSYPENVGDKFARCVRFGVSVDGFSVENIERHINNNVLVRVYADDISPEYGDHIYLSGKINIPGRPGNPYSFDYGDFLLKNGYSAVVSSGTGDIYFKAGPDKGLGVGIIRALFAARKYCSNILKNNFSSDTEAVLESILLGIRSSIPGDVKDLFVNTGTMHMLAVSGLHTGVVGLIALVIFRSVRFPHRPAYCLSVVLVFLYALFAGGRPSSLRAAMMFLFLVLNKITEKESRAGDVLILTAFICSFLWPLQVFSPGFLMSYVAVVSIISLTPVVDVILNVPGRKQGENVLEKMQRYFRAYLSLSLSVWLGMLPVIMHYFGVITPVVILANIAAIPMLLLVMVFGIFFIVFFAGNVPFALSFSVMLDRSIALFFIFLEHLSRFRFAYIKVSRPGFGLIAVYYALLAACVYYYRKKRQSRILMIFFMGVFSIVIWGEVVSSFSGRGDITFMDVGKADAVVFESDSGEVVLLDAGATGMAGGIDAGRDVIEPFLRARGIRKIDLAVISHAHEDHFGGLLYLIDQFEIDNIAVVAKASEYKDPASSCLFDRLMDKVKKKNIRLWELKKDDVVRGLDAGIFTVLSPDVDGMLGSMNEDSLVMRFEAKSCRSILLPADIGEKGMERLLVYGRALESDILKYPHHSAVPEDKTLVNEFIEEVAPDIVIISSDSIPDKTEKFLERFSGDIRVLSTMRDGAVIAEERDGGFSVEGFKSM